MTAVLLDVWLPGMDGLGGSAAGEERGAAALPAMIMIISGHGSIESAVRATKLGAFDFLEKPLTIEKVMVVLKNALEQRRLHLQLREIKDTSRSQDEDLGESVPMKALRQQILLMAATNGRVLIYGESGTGKELMAHAIHCQGRARRSAFIELNCAAIPEELLRVSCLGIARAASRGWTGTRSESWRRPTAGRCSWTRSGT
ncbi:MAG: sigma 54-interacting transcriptional regulator [Paludibaculum sp.]